MIKFNVPYLSGKEIGNVTEAISSGCISGDGSFTKKCQQWFNDRLGFRNTLLATSCTDALEMSAILLDIKQGDEVIIPSYTFVSTANAFLLRGAKIILADSSADSPNIDADKLETLITPNTKAIVIVHYAGMVCDMEKISAIVKKHNLFLVEDAALALGSSYKGKYAGSFGHLATFSFHATKNITCGEGGMLVVNDERFLKRAEIIREKGTNRNAFFRGEVDKYGWVDVGSSFLPSDMLAAFLYAQLLSYEEIQEKRRRLWELYSAELNFLEKTERIQNCRRTANEINYSIFYLVCNSPVERVNLVSHLKKEGIQSSFHYQALHKSTFYNHPELSLPYAEKYSDCLLRLPLYPDLTSENCNFIIEKIKTFFA